MLAGVSLAVKTLQPGAKVIGVEADHVASFSAALKAGKPVFIKTSPTLADGLAIAQVGGNAFEIARKYTDKTVLVTEEQIALAILRVVELEKGVVEGAAAEEGTHLPEAPCQLRGGKLEQAELAKAVISDRPGGLADLTAQIAAAGASIKQVVHDRAFASSDVSAVQVMCTVETRDREHLAELRATLAAHGIATE